MTQDEIIRSPLGREQLVALAREAGLGDHLWYTSDESEFVATERFAALVAEAEREKYEDLLHRIKSWAQAYPLSIFPEPDFKKAHEVLTANGITLDAISASNMRHVITQVQKMVDDALGEQK
jgi:hypothetical protein